MKSRDGNDTVKSPGNNRPPTRLFPGDLIYCPEVGQCKIIEVFGDGRKGEVSAEDEYGTVRRLTIGSFRFLERVAVVEGNVDDLHWERIREDYLCRPGRWCQYGIGLSLVLNGPAALLLAFLIGWQRTYGKGAEWFYCGTDEIAREAYVRPRSQELSFRTLRGMGFVETEMRGGPTNRRRWIRIDYRALRRGIEGARVRWEAEFGKPRQPCPE